jgi:hypothetical protein
LLLAAPVIAVVALVPVPATVRVGVNAIRGNFVGTPNFPDSGFTSGRATL